MYWIILTDIIKQVKQIPKPYLAIINKHVSLNCSLGYYLVVFVPVQNQNFSSDAAETLILYTIHYVSPRIPSQCCLMEIFN